MVDPNEPIFVLEAVVAAEIRAMEWDMMVDGVCMF